MPEYISKDYINNLLEAHLDHWCGPEHYTCSIIQDEINEVPVDEIVHFQIGKWEWRHSNEYTQILTCSACSRTEGADEHHKYCPNCGARMMEVDE